MSNFYYRQNNSEIYKNVHYMNFREKKLFCKE